MDTIRVVKKNDLAYNTIHKFYVSETLLHVAVQHEKFFSKTIPFMNYFLTIKPTYPRKTYIRVRPG